ncbi:MAG: DUF4129 domain-containing protein [Chloroflexi bacterium]|nr:DUF4129 domain-containing protein [Chloroflexota bacterium]
MNSHHDRFVLAAHLISEGAWMFALMGIFGLWFGFEGSPVAWLAVMVIMGGSLLASRTLNMIALPTAMAAGIQMLLGVVVLYLTLGTQIPTSVGVIDLGWIGNLSSNADGADNPRWAVLASAFAVYLWWRGGRIAASDNTAESLATSFRLGVLALASSIIVDIANEPNLNVFPMMFIFFGAGLAGLSFGNLMPAFETSSEGRTWPRVIGGMVAAVLLLGLAFSLLRDNVLSAISAPALLLLKGLGTVAFYVAVPFIYVVTFIVQGIFAILSWFAGERDVDTEVLGPIGFDFPERAEADAPAYLAIIGWVILALIIVAALLLLARAFRRRKRWRLEETSIIRESIREDADVGHDLAQLLLNLLPDRFKRRRRTGHFKLPDGDPDIVDVFRIYFGLLVMADERGFPRPATQTPAEYQNTLEEIFPRTFVRSVTAAFVKACYGHHAAPRTEIDEMRLSLERLVTEAE